MNGNRITFLNEYEKGSSNVQTISIDAPEIERLFEHVKNLRLLVKELDSPLLTEEFKNLERFFNLIMSSIVEYEYKLKGFDLKPIRSLFTSLLNTFGPEAKKDLNQISNLIPVFINSKIKNYNIIEINRIVNKNEDIGIVHYYWTDIEVAIVEKNKNISLIRARDLVDESRIFDKLIFMGTPRYFQSLDKIFLAKDIYYLSYSFFYNKFRKDSVIPGNNPNNSAIYKDFFIREE